MIASLAANRKKQEQAQAEAASARQEELEEAIASYHERLSVDDREWFVTVGWLTGEISQAPPEDS